MKRFLAAAVVVPAMGLIAPTPARATEQVANQFIVGTTGSPTTTWMGLGHGGTVHGLFQDAVYQLQPAGPYLQALRMNRFRVNTGGGGIPSILDLSFEFMTARGTARYDGQKWNLLGSATIVNFPLLQFPVPEVRFFIFWAYEPTPPVNDDFANRSTLSGFPVQAVGNLSGATVEGAEPWHAGVCPAATLWWSWTPTQDARVDISAYEILAVYTGTSLDTLTPVVSADARASSSPEALARLDVEAGTTYQIATAARYRCGSLACDYPITIAAAPPRPANDDFADATLLSGLPATASASTVGASPEPDEPQHLRGTSPNASLWWKWTAPMTGCVEIDTRDSVLTTIFGVYTGSELGTLTQVKRSNPGASTVSSRIVRLDVEAGTTYFIAVDGILGREGEISLRIAEAPPPPPNDDFANRSPIPGFPASASGTTVKASAEENEPDHGSGSPVRSIWWTWNAATSQDVVMTTLGSTKTAYLAVYTGTDLASLTPIAQSDGSPELVRFPATAGTRYQIMTDIVGNRFNPAWYPGDDEGDVELSILAPPANDDFADRTPLIGLPVSASSNNLGAGAEPDEPRHDGQLTLASLWWTWTSPSTGRVRIETLTTGAPTVIGVYTGTDLGTLQAVAADWDEVEFQAVAGTPYQIAVDARSDRFGSVDVSLSLAPSQP